MEQLTVKRLCAKRRSRWPDELCSLIDQSYEGIDFEIGQRRRYSRLRPRSSRFLSSGRAVPKYRNNFFQRRIEKFANVGRKAVTTLPISVAMQR